MVGVDHNTRLFVSKHASGWEFPKWDRHISSHTMA